MLRYQRKLLIDGSDIGAPGPLPHELVGLLDESLADLSAALPAVNCDDLGIAGQGFFPVDAPDPIDEVGARVIAAIDAERDRRQRLDFDHDFGAILAIDDFGAEIAADVRTLQMGPADQQNWGFLQGQALAAVIGGAPATLMPMRAEDNWNVQTTAAQVLTVTAAMFGRNAILLFHGGQLKSQARAAIAADDQVALVAVEIETGWPS